MPKYYTKSLLTHSTDLVQTDFSNCSHTWKHHGYWPSLTKGIHLSKSRCNQRLRCIFCGKTRTVGRRTKEEFLSDIGKCFVSGMSIAQAARQVGCHRFTVFKYYKILRAYKDLPCPCGRVGNHLGPCWFKLGLKEPTKNSIRWLKRKSNDNSRT